MNKEFGFEYMIIIMKNKITTGSESTGRAILSVWDAVCANDLTE